MIFMMDSGGHSRATLPLAAGLREPLADFGLEKIIDVFPARDHFHATILLEPELRRAPDGIVIARHRVAISARVPQREQIARRRPRQHARREQLAIISRENIPALAERPRDHDWLPRYVRI